MKNAIRFDDNDEDDKEEITQKKKNKENRQGKFKWQNTCKQYIFEWVNRFEADDLKWRKKPNKKEIKASVKMKEKKRKNKRSVERNKEGEIDKILREK